MAAAGQQVGGVGRIAQALELIHQATAANLEGAQHAEGAAGELASLAERLRQVVAQYRL